jgi:CRISPR-associated protein Csd1
MNCQSVVGRDLDDNTVPLLPICHTTQKAQITIVIDPKGNFIKAQVIPKNDARTIIPCSENSGGRTSGEAPHPLCDKLQYIASDYKIYGGKKKPYFNSYLSQLEEWSKSEYSHPMVKAIYDYVRKGKVLQDLIHYKVLFSGKNSKLLETRETKKEKNAPPDIFDLIKSQDEAFVRWEVEIPGNRETKVWKDKTLWDSWIHFYTGTKKVQALCYVTGKKSLSADQHPAKLRNDGDKAKLISSNDLSGFTFRGRFLNSDEACGVGFEVSQKAHYALRWLISRQGYKKGDQAIVAWATSGADTPQPTDDSLSFFDKFDFPSDQPPTASTAQELAIQLKKKIAGYAAKLGDTAEVVVMALDSATPGRMSITYYRTLSGSEFLKRIDEWHETCSWIHNYKSIEFRNENKVENRFITFVGAPSPADIAEAAYGNRVDDKLRKSTVERILPCIIDGQNIPHDLVESAVRRASNRVGLENYDWNKTLSIACALFKGYNRKEAYTMTLDLHRKTRDYLYGRLLALADSLEQWALSETGEKRPTNAARLMNRFSEHPYTTWRTIELALAPYKARLGGKSIKRQRMIDDVMNSFNPDEFSIDKKLSGEFLLGFHCQRAYLWNNAGPDDDSNSNGTEISTNQ